MGLGLHLVRDLYEKSPAFLKNVMATLYGFRERYARYGEHYTRWLRFLEESQWWDLEQLMNFQRTELSGFIEDALRWVPYYRARHVYLAAGDLSQMPVLSKQEVRKHLRSFLHDGLSRLKVRMVQTSGTTGTPLRFPVTLECFEREYAFRALHYSWAGVRLDSREPIAVCAGHPVVAHNRVSPPFWVYDWANNWLVLSSYHLSPKNLRAYVRVLERFQPVLLVGYPSSLYILAGAYQRFGTRPLSLRGVFTGSETLQTFQREKIEGAFGVKTFNWYGNTEMCANIVECEAGELHLKVEHSAVEIINDDGTACGQGQRGKLVCTGFGNRAFPLIRYDTGDEVTLSSSAISQCGRGGILVQEVHGRREDYVFTPDGRMVGRLDHLFKGKNHVIEGQLVQEKLEELLIRIVKSEQFTPEDEIEILQEARKRLGDSIAFRIEYTEHIARGPNGKFKFLVSSLDQQTLLNEFLSH